MFQESLEGGMQLLAHTEHGIVITVNQRGLLVIAHPFCKTRRNEQVAIDFFPLYGFLSFGLVGIAVGNPKGRCGIDHPHDATGSRSIVGIHDPHRQILHLSIAEDGGHEHQREQG